MDFFAAIRERMNDPEQRRAKEARRAIRQEKLWSKLGDIVAGTRTAETRWNIQDDNERHEGVPIGNQHPGHAAVIIARQALQEFQLPTSVEYRIGRIERASGHGAHRMDEGRIDVEVTLASISGPRHAVKIPVTVKNGRLLYPSVLLHNGTPRVLTQHTFDDILSLGEFTRDVPDRKNMYSPPPDEPKQREAVPLLHPGLFKVVPHRGLIRGAARGRRAEGFDREAQLAQIAEWLVQHPQAAMAIVQSFPKLVSFAQKVASGAFTLQDALQIVKTVGPAVIQSFIKSGSRRAFFEPDVAGPTGTRGPDVPGADGSHLDPAERDRSDHKFPGEEVRTIQALEVRDRGGVKYEISRGSVGTVSHDMDGTGFAYVVCFEDLGFAATVPAWALGG